MTVDHVQGNHLISEGLTSKKTRESLEEKGILPQAGNTEVLPEFPACWSALQVSHLPVQMIKRAIP